MSHRHIRFTAHLLGLSLASAAVFANASEAHGAGEPTHIIEVPAATRAERTRIANLGFAIDELRSDKVYIYGTPRDEKILKAAGFTVKAYAFKPEWSQWTTRSGDIVPTAEYRYHSFNEVSSRLTQLTTEYSAISSLVSLGNTIENRAMPMVRISGKTPGDAETQKLPAIIYMGCHHAREHLSVEVPLLYIEYLLKNYGKDANVTRLVDSREIYIAPMVNPDGHTFDYRAGQTGRSWRKNRRVNGDGTMGVDLNRNYGYRWGTGGSSTDTSSDVYMGRSAFSEPETQNIRNFVRSQPRITTLLTLHSFSELVLYPWGYTYDDLGQNGAGTVEDLTTFKKMADTMAGWNGYTPQQSSDLYITSGDTTDWAYGELGIFAFTFELTPSSIFSGGFYPEPTVIKPTFEANLKPLLYMLEFADNPRRTKTDAIPDYLAKEVSPASRGVPMASVKDLRF